MRFANEMCVRTHSRAVLQVPEAGQKPTGGSGQVRGKGHGGPGLNGRRANRHSLTRAHAGERDKGLGESTPDSEAGRNAPAGVATSPGLDWGCKREPAGGSGVATRVPMCQQGPRRGPLCLRGGGLAGPGAPEPRPRSVSCGTGRAAHLPPGHSGPHCNLRPAASPAAQPTRPRLGISEGPDSRRLRRGASPNPDRRSSTHFVARVLSVKQRLPPARPRSASPAAITGRGQGRGAAPGATLPAKPAGAASAPPSEF